MQLSMIVLKEVTTEAADFELVSVEGADAPAERKRIAIEIRETSAGDRRDLKNDKNILAAAPPMPINLIESFEASATADAALQETGSWGVAAVKAEPALRLRSWIPASIQNILRSRIRV